MTELTVVDLFAGPGGWDEGLRMSRPGAKVVGIEWDASAVSTAVAAGHRRLGPDDEGDVSKLHPTFFKKACYLHASPPCQGFSLAGKGAGRLDGERLLRALELACGYPFDQDTVEALMETFNRRANDPRSVLTLEPLRWIAGIRPTYVTLEQVPTVQPVWDAYAETLRAWGYHVWTGILNAEQYGVPQTRRRAVLMASLAGPVAPPKPTHSKFYPRDRDRLDPGVLPWVSMAEALGWGMTVRPSMTVTGGGAATGGAEPFGNGARQGMHRELDEGRWHLRGNQKPGGSGDYQRRDMDSPAPTLTSGARSAAWEMGDVRSGRGTVRGEHEPAPTMTASMDNGNFRFRQRSNYSAGGPEGSTAAERGLATRELHEPSFTMTSKGAHWEPIDDEAVIAEVTPRLNNQSGTDFDLSWPAHRPAASIAGRGLATMPGANANRFNGSTKSRNDGIRIEPFEAGILQSFPADYPWQGNKGQQFQQVGNAVPPLLAAAVTDALLP